MGISWKAIKFHNIPHTLTKKGQPKHIHKYKMQNALIGQFGPRGIFIPTWYFWSLFGWESKAPLWKLYFTTFSGIRTVARLYGNGANIEYTRTSWRKLVCCSEMDFIKFIVHLWKCAPISQEIFIIIEYHNKQFENAIIHSSGSYSSFPFNMSFLTVNTFLLYVSVSVHCLWEKDFNVAVRIFLLSFIYAWW